MLQISEVSLNVVVLLQLVRDYARLATRASLGLLRRRCRRPLNCQRQHSGLGKHSLKLPLLLCVEPTNLHTTLRGPPIDFPIRVVP